MKINIIIPDKQTAFYLFSNNIMMLDWFNAHNRPYVQKYLKSLNIPFMDNMIDDRNLEDKEFYSKYFEKFCKNLYKEDKYNTLAENIKGFLPQLYNNFEKFEDFHKSWGFKIFPEYNILVNIYAGGGRYNTQNAKIIIGDAPKERLVGTITHEAIHLGIEDDIVKKFNLPQEEKERIVDNLQKYIMLESLFQEVAKCASYMDDVVGDQPNNNLPKAIEKMIQENKIKRYF